jgi:deazaflavin-dependent oxidoreductase (nitroreductase family)
MTTIYYQRPSRLRVGFINPLLRFLIRRFGFGGRGADLLRILLVRGRKSGRLYEVPVRVAAQDGQRYILSMLGETQWARNLQAVTVAQLIVGKTVEPIRAHEIAGEEKAAFLTWYCQHPQFEPRARYALKVDTKHLTPAEVDRVARLYPVFRLEPVQSLEPKECAAT